jgi:hypothetical protein
MSNTPKPPKGQNAETMTYAAKKQRGISADEGGLNEKASFTPSSSINEHSYGKDGGRANAQSGSVPSIQVGGSYEVAALPAMPGTLTIGDDKNVSTPVSG